MVLDNEHMRVGGHVPHHVTYRGVSISVIFYNIVFSVMLYLSWKCFAVVADRGIFSSRVLLLVLFVVSVVACSLVDVRLAVEVGKECDV